VEGLVRQLDPSKPAAALRDEMIGKAKEFQGKAQQHDDMTLVVVKLLR
jgi:serine phosphatase RsbU (regulator of sigma subunit)